jgi:hypothetical protein
MFPRRKQRQRAKNGLIGADEPTDSGVTIVTMLPELLALLCPALETTTGIMARITSPTSTHFWL